MKPIIGICANYSIDDRIGLKTGLGLIDQDWQLLANDYIISIERAGGIPLILPVTEDPQTCFRLLDMLDGVLFTGGSDIDPQCYGELPKYGLERINPKRDKHELALVSEVLHHTSLPILGICRGMQMLTVATGGSLYQDLRLERSEGFNHTIMDVPRNHVTHTVSIEENSLFHRIFSQREIGVNSFNHQAVKQVGEGFCATVTAPDGLIEGVERKGDRFIGAVQWHPEMMGVQDTVNFKLFSAFINTCTKGGDSDGDV